MLRLEVMAENEGESANDFKLSRNILKTTHFMSLAKMS